LPGLVAAWSLAVLLAVVIEPAAARAVVGVADRVLAVDPVGVEPLRATVLMPMVRLGAKEDPRPEGSQVGGH
jgi:hypothetical protein